MCLAELPFSWHRYMWQVKEDRTYLEGNVLGMPLAIDCQDEDDVDDDDDEAQQAGAHGFGHVPSWWRERVLEKGRPAREVDHVRRGGVLPSSNHLPDTSLSLSLSLSRCSSFITVLSLFFPFFFSLCFLQVFLVVYYHQMTLFISFVIVRDLASHSDSSVVLISFFLSFVLFVLEYLFL